MQLLYTLLVYLLIPAALLRLFLRGFKEPGYRKRILERFAFALPMVPAQRKCLCIHAVSVGESLAAGFLLDMLERRFPRHTIAMSSMTPSGSEIIQRTYGSRVVHAYLPYDFPRAAQRYLDHFKPEAFIVMETEIWPNMLAQCHKRGIPTLLMNGRLSERSARNYRFIAPLICPILANIDLIIAQSPEDAQRFVSLGAVKDRVRVAGNLKYLIDVRCDENAMREARKALAGQRLIWIAGSTHAGEEEIVLRVHRELRRQFPDLLLILAPRHIFRCPEIAALCMENGLKVACCSKTTKACPSDAAVFLLDVLGELRHYYAYADVAFVGGSLTVRGGHNVLEPIACGVMAITGMHMQNFHTIVNDLLPTGALRQVCSEQELRKAVEECLADIEQARTRAALGREFIAAQASRIQEIESTIYGFLEKPSEKPANLGAKPD